MSEIPPAVLQLGEVREVHELLGAGPELPQLQLTHGHPPPSDSSAASASRPRIRRDLTVPSGHLEQVGDLGHGLVREVVQREHLALGLGELSQRLDDRHVLLEPGQVRRGCLETWSHPAEVAQLAPPVPVQVDRGPAQPGLRVVDAAEPAARGGGPHERLLHQVLGLGEVADHAVQLHHQSSVGQLEDLGQGRPRRGDRGLAAQGQGFLLCHRGPPLVARHCRTTREHRCGFHGGPGDRVSRLRR